MIKIRIQGTKKDIRWLTKVLYASEGVKVNGVSHPFANKGTSKYYRVYVEIEKQ